MAGTITIIIVALGFLPLLIVLWKKHRVKKLKETGDLVTGVVEEVYERRGLKGNKYYQAVIQYPVFGKGQLRGIYTYSSNRTNKLFTRGQRTAIYYDKNKPEKFIPKDVPFNNVFLLFTIIIAIGYLVIGFFLYGFLKKEGIT